MEFIGIVIVLSMIGLICIPLIKDASYDWKVFLVLGSICLLFIGIGLSAK